MPLRGDIIVGWSVFYNPVHSESAHRHGPRNPEKMACVLGSDSALTTAYDPAATRLAIPARPPLDGMPPSIDTVP